MVNPGTRTDCEKIDTTTLLKASPFQNIGEENERKELYHGLFTVISYIFSVTTATDVCFSSILL